MAVGQEIGHHWYHMLTCVVRVGRWGGSRTSWAVIAIGADGFDDAARQALKHEISDVTTLHALLGDDFTCRSEHDPRHPAQSPTRPDHRPLAADRKIGET